MFTHHVIERPQSTPIPLSDAVQNATASDPQIVWRAGVVQQCSARTPPDPKPQETAVVPAVAAVGEIFLGKAIDFGIDAFAHSMAEAAKRDSDGLSFATSAPVYIVDVKRDKEDENAKDKAKGKGQGDDSKKDNEVRSDYVVTERRCIVVARGHLAASTSSPNWCAHDSNATNGPCGTNNRRKALSEIARNLGIDAPSFYAEIALDPADTRDAVSGELVYLHYPQFLTERKGATRDLLIAATLSSPAADPAAATKLATFAFTLRRLKEGQALYGATSVGGLASGWSPLPEPYTDTQIERVAKTRLCESQGCEFSALPATLTVTIRETGDVNAFLQYMSAWLATADAQKAIAEPIKDEVLPSKKVAAKATEDNAAAKLSSDFEAAVTGSMNARKAYEAACEGMSSNSPPSARTNLAILYYAWEGAYEKSVSAGKSAAEEVPSSAGPPTPCSAHN